MPGLPREQDLKNLQKFPWQWALIAAISAIGFVINLYLTRVGKSDNNCDQQIITLNKTVYKKDSIIFDWQNKYINLSNELLYKNNVIERQMNVIHSTDSVARKRFEPAAKQIVKANE